MSEPDGPARRFGVLTALRLGRDPGRGDDEEPRRRADAVRRVLVEGIRAAAALPPAPARRRRRRRAR